MPNGEHTERKGRLPSERTKVLLEQENIEPVKKTPLVPDHPATVALNTLLDQDAEALQAAGLFAVGQPILHVLNRDERAHIILFHPAASRAERVAALRRWCDRAED
jgi:hypothetical protein